MNIKKINIINELKNIAVPLVMKNFDLSAKRNVKPYDKISATNISIKPATP